MPLKKKKVTRLHISTLNCSKDPFLQILISSWSTYDCGGNISSHLVPTLHDSSLLACSFRRASSQGCKHYENGSEVLSQKIVKCASIRP